MLNNQQLPLRVQFFYGGLEGGLAVVASVVQFFFLFFLTNIVGINPATAGTLLLIAGIWDAVTDPLVGIISDRTHTRWGSRRPFIITFLLPFIICAWLLFAEFGFGDQGAVIYYFCAACLFYVVQDFVVVPGGALAAEITRDYDERASLNSWKAGWAALGGVFGLVLPLILAERFGWSAMIAILGSVAALPILLAWRFTRGYEPISAETTQLTLTDLREMLLNNKPFINLAGLVLTGFCAIGTLIVALVFFLEHVLQYGENEIALLFLVLQLAGLLFVLPVDWGIKRFGKQRVMIVGGFVSLTVYLSLFFAHLAPPWAIYIAAMSAAGAYTVLFIPLGAMLPDVTEVDEFKSGQRREGVYFAAFTFLGKLAFAFSNFLVGILLDWTGFSAESPTPNSLLMMRLLISIAPALFAALLIWISLANPMTRQKHAALRQAIVAKQNGQPVELDELEGII